MSLNAPSCSRIVLADIEMRPFQWALWTWWQSVGCHLSLSPRTAALSSRLHWICPCDHSFLQGRLLGLISKEVPLGSSSEPVELPLQPSKGMLLPRRWHSTDLPSQLFSHMAPLSSRLPLLQSYNLAREELFCGALVCHCSLLSRLVVSTLTQFKEENFLLEENKLAAICGQRMWIWSASTVYYKPEVPVGTWHWGEISCSLKRRA